MVADVGKPRVLIAEDESHSRFLVKAIVNSMNCEVVGEAGNGVEAVEMFRKLKPHMLLLDINMPIKTGDEVLREIMSEYPKAFVIMLTSVSDMESIEKCIALGAANYIRKDTPISEIKSIIRETWNEYLKNKNKEIS